MFGFLSILLIIGISVPFSVCELCEDTTLRIRDPQSCTRYGDCSDGIFKIVNCPDNTTFDGTTCSNTAPCRIGEIPILTMRRDKRSISRDSNVQNVGKRRNERKHNRQTPAEIITSTSKPSNQPPTSTMPGLPLKADAFLPSHCGRKESYEKKPSLVGVGNIEESPWQVALIRREKLVQVCGGSVISNRHVVTAAMCLRSRKKEELFVFAGSNDLNATVKQWGILDVYLHEIYDSITKENDIALIVIEGEFEFGPTIQPICLPTNGERFITGQECTMTGWGLTKDNVKPTKLKTFQETIWSNQKCQEVYGKRVKAGMICAAGKDGQTTCRGDGGGPMACQEGGIFTLVGVSSSGVSCHQNKYPDIHTRVSEYVSWIKERVEVSIADKSSKKLEK